MVDRPAFSSHLSDIHVRLLLIVVFLMCFHGCSDRATNPEDTTPPARVTDLVVSAVTDHSAILAWTAPGDDGDKGQAWKYDLRYDTRPISGTWGSATQVDSLPRPQVAGSREQVVIDSLKAETTYYFALRTEDEVGNYDLVISNVASAKVSADTIPPATIADLTVVNVTHQSVELSWTAPGDNGYEGQAGVYDVRYSRQGLTNESWEMATKIEDVQSPGPVGSVETLGVDGLVDATEYFFGVKTKDEAVNWSHLSNVPAVTTLPDTLPPAVVSDLAVVAATHSTLTLAWTAPGDDGVEGRASVCEIRYSEKPITAWNWAEAQPVMFPPTPSEPGGRDKFTVPLLEPERLYHFALRTADERGNWSQVSNDSRGTLKPRTGRTWQVRPDGSGDVITVQEGIEAAADGDVVLVGPSTYYENINLRGKAIHLLGELGPELTILDGSQGDSSVVTCNSGEGNDTVIEGFTITHGRGVISGINGRHGAGIRCMGAAPTIRGSVVKKNRAESPPGGNQCWGGGMIFWGEAEPLIIEDCVFEENFATSNGGAIWAEGPCIVQRNLFTRNSTKRGDGGGLYIARTPDSVYRDNFFMENQAGDHGGGIYVGNGGVSSVPPREIEICGNIVMFNRSRTTIAPDCSGAGIWVFGGAHIYNNTIAFNWSDSRNYPTGGGICLVNTEPGTIIENNLIYRNHEGGIVAFKFSGPDASALLSRNLVFDNGRAEIFNKYEPDFNFELEENLFVDPMFCTHGPESRGEVAGGSPVLNQLFGVIGAVSQSGCSPYIEPAGGQTTWGAITARHRLPASQDPGEGRDN